MDWYVYTAVPEQKPGLHGTWQGRQSQALLRAVVQCLCPNPEAPFHPLPVPISPLSYRCLWLASLFSLTVSPPLLFSPMLSAP